MVHAEAFAVFSAATQNGIDRLLSLFHVGFIFSFVSDFERGKRLCINCWRKTSQIYKDLFVFFTCYQDYFTTFQMDLIILSVIHQNNVNMLKMGYQPPNSTLIGGSQS